MDPMVMGGSRFGSMGTNMGLPALSGAGPGQGWGGPSPPPVPALDLPNLPKNCKLFAVLDRQVLFDEENPPSLYALCRKWVQNDPDVDFNLPPEPPSASLPEVQVPEDEPEAEREAERQRLAVAGPAPPRYREPGKPQLEMPSAKSCRIDDAMRRFKEHWVGVRKWHQAKQRHTLERRRHRLGHIAIKAAEMLLEQQAIQTQQAAMHAAAAFAAAASQQQQYHAALANSMPQ